MRIPLSPHGTKELALAAVAAAAGTAAGWWVSRLVGGPPLAIGIAAVWAILFGYVCSFFRDPERRAPDAPGLLSPADGTVADVQEVDEPEFVKARCLRIGIFLSIFNCHVNRAPIAGTVAWLSHREGKFHDARSPLAATENESNWIGLDTAEGRLAVKQISGKIARRIVCPLKLGDVVARGQRLGLIKFGSRTELYIPLTLGYTAAVRVGDPVRGSVTLLATRAGAAAPGRA